MTGWALALFIGAAVLAQAGPALGGEGEAAAEACCPGSGEAAKSCTEAWKAKHQAMVEKKAEMEARLDELVGTMNAAQGDAKVDAVAAVLNELISQRKAMHQRKHRLHGHGKCPSCASKCGRAKAEAEEDG
jgi:hypothetical protein